MPLHLLRRSPLLRALPASALKRILKISKLKAFPKGTDIFSKAQQATHMFIVNKGRVKIYSRSHAKKSKTFAYLTPGGFFGEMALLDGRERSASAQAVEDSELLLINKTDFRKLLYADPALPCRLLKTMSERLRVANEEIESLLFRNVLGRVSKALVDLADHHGRKFRGGVLLGDQYTHQELADLVGTTREPLSRALASLRRAELVAVRHGQIFLRDPKKMKVLIGDTGAV